MYCYSCGYDNSVECIYPDFIPKRKEMECKRCGFDNDPNNLRKNIRERLVAMIDKYGNFEDDFDQATNDIMELIENWRERNE